MNLRTWLLIVILIGVIALISIGKWLREELDEIYERDRQRYEQLMDNLCVKKGT